jgi:hypothetical protein
MMLSGGNTSRRRLLRAGGAGAVVCLAGCLGALDSGDDAGPPPEPVDLSGTKFDYSGSEAKAHGFSRGMKPTLHATIHVT